MNFYKFLPISTNFNKFLFISIVSIIFYLFLPVSNVEAGVIVRPAMNNGLIGYWNFDVGKGGTTAYDMSGQRNHGTLTNMDPATDWVDSATTTGRLLGQALDFDGAAFPDNDFVAINSALGISDEPLTMCAWFNSDNLGPDGWGTTIVAMKVADATDFNHRRYINVAPPGILRATSKQAHPTEASASSASGAISTGTWYYACGVFASESSRQIYLDGSLVGTDTTTINPNTPTLTRIGLLINTTDNGGESRFDGLIDEVRIYNRALSAAEISRLYKVSKPKLKVPTKAGLVGYWSFNEGTGTVAGDASGQGNNGNFPGGTANPTWATGKLGQALEFDGGNDVVLNNIITLPFGDFAVSWWQYARSEGEDANGHSWSFADSSATDSVVFRFRATNTNFPEFKVDFGGAIVISGVANDITLGTWQHWAVVFRSSDRTGWIFRNGQQIATNSGGTGAATLTGIRIGAGTSAGAVAFDGLLDEVRIYNRALNVTEIQNLYQSGLVKINASTVGKLNNGLVGHWTFDGPDMAGVTAFDRSGQGNNGTLTNGPTRAIGRLGQALEFDGGNDVVNAGSSAVLDDIDVKTVSAWMYTKDLSGTGSRRVVDKEEGLQGWFFGVFNTNDNIIYGQTFSNNPNWQTPANSISANQWHHIAVVYDRTSTANDPTIYMNGVVQVLTESAVPTGSVVSDAAQNLGIGGRADAGGNMFNGLLDDVRIYNRALSADEIKRLYNMGR